MDIFSLYTFNLLGTDGLYLEAINIEYYMPFFVLGVIAEYVEVSYRHFIIQRLVNWSFVSIFYW